MNRAAASSFAPRRLAPWAAAVFLAWTAVAFLSALQGYVASASQGEPQAWWPSLGYALAIFSIWAALTGPIVLAVLQVERSGRPLPQRLLVYLAGVFLVGALHVGLFVLVFWPVYSDGGRLTRWAMGERMFVRNFGENVVLYAALVAIVALTVRRAARAALRAPEVLRARTRAGVRLIPLSEVDWIGAAGDYAEAHTRQGAYLVDETLAGLAERLPAQGFARIHRSAIVRLDRVRTVRSLGRGDAEVVLECGRVLRLSRRYRPALAGWLA